ncbi:MerR family transcriptional regulator [Megalodesulfovibrio paquesii]
MTEEQLHKIGEVARLLEVNSSVLRFWETEFPQLDPVRTEGGQRLYTEAHLALLLEIKRLLYEEKRTIQGARQALEARFPAPPGSSEQLALIDLSPRPAPLQPPRPAALTLAATMAPEPPRPPKADPRRDILLLDIAAELRAIRRLLEDE